MKVAVGVTYEIRNAPATLVLAVPITDHVFSGQPTSPKRRHTRPGTVAPVPTAAHLHPAFTVASFTKRSFGIMTDAQPAGLDLATSAIFRGLARAVGNTPLLAVDFRYRGSKRTVYAKAEHLNFTGSIKDRMALHILESAYAEGAIRAGDAIVEATSGNTGISFAAIGRTLGHPVTIFMPDWMSRERVDLIRSFGATVVPVSREEGGFLGSIERAEDTTRRGGRVFLPRQFANQANVRAHQRTTGPEIWIQLTANGLAPDAFVAGVGTGGTVMGVGRYLKSRRAEVNVHPLEPAESPMLSSGRKVGKHRIQGVSDEFIPPIVDLALLDEPIGVSDGDAILMAQALAAKLGLGVGISSGANFLGALLAQERLGPDAVAVTVFADDNKKYLSTSLLEAEPVKDTYLSPDVELLVLRTFRRACRTCVDFEDCSLELAARA